MFSGNRELGVCPKLIRVAGTRGVERLIFPPPAVTGPTEKSAFLYSVQRTFLRSRALSPIARSAAFTFYDSRGELRSVWKKGVVGGGSYGMVRSPDNEGLGRVLGDRNLEAFRWHWVNPADSTVDWRKRLPALNDQRVVGLKVHPYWHGLSADHIDEILDVARACSLPVYVYLGYGGMRAVLDVFARYPDVPILLACGGFPHFDRLWARIRPMTHVGIDFASQHIDWRGIRDSVRVLGSKRCLLATDAPYSLSSTDPQGSYGQFVERVR